MCCCLCVALPLCAVSALLLALLGPAHFHAVPVAEDGGTLVMAGWQDFRRVNHLRDSTVLVHDHTKLGRHHHDPRDGSVVVVGAGEHEDDADLAAPGAATLIVLAVSSADRSLPPLVAAHSANWHPTGPCRFHSCDARRLDRPPIG